MHSNCEGGRECILGEERLEIFYRLWRVFLGFVERPTQPIQGHLVAKLLPRCRKVGFLAFLFSIKTQQRSTFNFLYVRKWRYRVSDGHCQFSSFGLCAIKNRASPAPSIQKSHQTRSIKRQKSKNHNSINKPGVFIHPSTVFDKIGKSVCQILTNLLLICFPLGDLILGRRYT